MFLEFDPIDKDFILERESFIRSMYVSPPSDAKIPNGIGPEALSLSTNYSDLRKGFEEGWKRCLKMVNKTRG